MKRCVLAALLFLASTLPVLAGPKVVVTLKPVHGLIAGVMSGVGEPHLLLATGADPHSHALRPSEARALAGADAVFWIGPVLEAFLQKPLKNLASGARVVTLFEAPGVRHLPARRGGIWGRGGHNDHRGHGDHGGHDHHGDDPHVWLDPRNAQAMVRQAVAVLSELDPEHQIAYERNGKAVRGRLARLEREIHQTLGEVRALPYLVLHDAYQYFEGRFRTHGVGAIAISPERKPGARRISKIRQRLQTGRVGCLFREADISVDIVATLTEGLDIRVGVLDPIGRSIAPGPDAYEATLRQLARNLENCLSYGIGP